MTNNFVGRPDQPPIPEEQMQQHINKTPNIDAILFDNPCSGPNCPHETAEDHYLIWKEAKAALLKLLEAEAVDAPKPHFYDPKIHTSEKAITLDRIREVLK